MTKKKKLKIGLLLDDYTLAAWSFKMIEDIINSDYAEIALVILNDNPKPERNKTIAEKLRKNYGNISSICFRTALGMLYDATIARHSYIADANEEFDAKGLLHEIPALNVKTIRKKWSDYFKDSDISQIKDENIDILIRCGFRILRGEILNTANYGIWSYHHGDNNINRGGPPGFWESVESWPETGSVLQIISEDLDNGKVLYRSYSCTNDMSIQDNRSNYYWKSLTFITRKMRELHEIGPEAFFERVEFDNRQPCFYSNRLYVQPTDWELAKLVFKKLIQKVKILCSHTFYLEQWILMFHLNKEFSSSLWRYKKIAPPKDRFWADPHVIFRDNKYFIFIEELMYETNKGHISLITMDKDGNYQQPDIILEKPYHLSYPFVLEHDNEFYMVPESSANRTIELYKCVEFPHRWEFHMNLMENVCAYDATLLFHDQKWWLFANMIEHEGASSWDELFLFSADELLSKDWRPHPLNPIVSDCKRARPAGQIFTENGRIYRPSQDCSHRYGYGFNLSEITILNEAHYEEQLISQVKPNWDRNIIGTHTFNRSGSLHMIDAIYKRKRWGK